MHNIDLSVIVPCYNEQTRIEHTVDVLLKTLKNLDLSYQIILVNDGSIDHTHTVLRKISLQDSHIKVVSYSINRGKGYAIKQGIASVTGSYYLLMDADLATDINSLSVFWTHRASADCLIGNRNISDNHLSGWRALAGKFSNIVTRSLLGLHLKDTQCGFKLFNSTTTKSLRNLVGSKRWGYDFEILYLFKKHHISVREIPVHWVAVSGSKVNILSYFHALRELLGVLYRHNWRKF